MTILFNSSNNRVYIAVSVSYFAYPDTTTRFKYHVHPISNWFWFLFLWSFLKLWCISSIFLAKADFHLFNSPVLPIFNIDMFPHVKYNYLGQYLNLSFNMWTSIPKIHLKVPSLKNTALNDVDKFHVPNPVHSDATFERSILWVCIQIHIRVKQAAAGAKETNGNTCIMTWEWHSCAYLSHCNMMSALIWMIMSYQTICYFHIIVANFRHLWSVCLYVNAFSLFIFDFSINCLK